MVQKSKFGKQGYKSSGRPSKISGRNDPAQSTLNFWHVLNIVAGPVHLKILARTKTLLAKMGSVTVLKDWFQWIPRVPGFFRQI